MNKCRGNHVWRPMTGAVVAGLLVCSVAVVAAPPTGVRPASNRDSQFPSLVDIPVAPPVHAYRTQTVLQREGGGEIAVSYAGDPTRVRLWDGAAAAALGTCFRNSDCDDCDPCTTDTCIIPPNQITGVCDNPPSGACGVCSDGVFCNGTELCNSAGGCRPATNGACFSQSGTICDELGGPQRLGSCDIPCQTAGDCDDGAACTGVEVCILQECVNGDNAGAPCTDDTPCTGVGGFCGGVCRSAGFPCGAVAGCTEVLATNSFTCSLKGRCCQIDGNGDFTICSRETKPACDTLGGRWLNVGDNPATVQDEGLCNVPAPPDVGNAGETFNCPLYSAGILPGSTGQILGKIGSASCNALQELGDDYHILGCQPGQFFEVTTIRWVGGWEVDGIVGSNSRYRWTFRDTSLNFIEDTITNPASDGTVQLRTVIFQEKPVIPCDGFVSILGAPRFSPFAKFNWAQATSVETGTNDANVMLVNGAKVDFLAGSSQLAFELIGSIVGDPNGACCNSTTGGCTSELPWVCEQQGGAFQGNGSLCASCSNDLFKSCAVNADCPACSNDGSKCDPNVDCPGGTCVALVCAQGTNNGNACDPNIGCTGAATCDTTTTTATCDAIPFACTLTACCNDTDGSCTTVSAPATCPTGSTPLGFGTTCDPNCCAQKLAGLDNGYDTCAEASLPANLILFVPTPNPANPHEFQMPLPGDQPTTVTFSGNNLGATFGDVAGGTGTCEFGIFDQAGGTQDRGWWHSFSISACANVRVDFCCSAERSGEVKQPQWANLWNTCNPCVTTLGASVVGGAASGGVGTNTASGDRGLPFCGSDDLWETFGPIVAGTYWVPVFSAPAGTFGDYQLHITVGACPIAACCLPNAMCVNTDGSLELDVLGGVIPCTFGDNTPCSGGATCEFCAETNQLDCNLAEGFYNGFGNIPLQQDPVISCFGGTCDLGSCCLGAGDCRDDAGPAFTCDRTQPNTCMNRALCNGLGGSFSGEVTCANPTPPCPTCVFQGANNCQLPFAPDDGLPYMSDLSASGRNGIVTADDFVPQGTTIGSVCVWGTYLDPTLGGQDPNAFECTGVVADHFRVRVFNDRAGAVGTVDGPGLPGTLLGESEVTGTNIAFGLELTDNTPQFFGRYQFAFRGYTLTLDTPITGMVAGKTYWLEVANATFAPEDNRCEWHWAQYLDPVDDGFCAVGISPSPDVDPSVNILSSTSVYVNGSGRGGSDMGFCLADANGDPLAFDAPPTPVGCCWQCDGTNAIATARACIGPSAANGTPRGLWDGRDPACAKTKAPPQPNDTCRRAPPPLGSVAGSVCGNGIVEAGEQCDPLPIGSLPTLVCDINCQLICVADSPPGNGPLKITNGLFRFDTACATNDGPLVVEGDLGNFALDGDIWYEYKATCTGILITDQCATQTSFTQDGFSAIDSAIAIYHDFNDPFNCPCPGITTGKSPLQAGLGGDESCNGISDAGAGFLFQITSPAECWLIRVGGFLAEGGTVGEGSTGRGLLSVSCEEVVCFISSTPEPATVENVGGAPVPLRTMRFLSFQGGNPGKKQAARVTFKCLPPPWDVWNGTRMWVDAPFEAQESGGAAITDPVFACTGGSNRTQPCAVAADCPGGSCDKLPVFNVAKLKCNLNTTTDFRDWTLEGVVNIFNEGIVPSTLRPKLDGSPGTEIGFPAIYEIQFIEKKCSPNREESFSPPLTIVQAGWADLGELFAGTFRAVDDAVSIFDVLAIQAKFAGDLNATTKPRNELTGNGDTGPIGPIDGKMNIGDLLAILTAFGGGGYPFGPPSTPPACVPVPAIVNPVCGPAPLMAGR